MRPTASSTGDDLGLAEERVARRDDHLVAQRRRRADDRRDRAVGARCRLTTSSTSPANAHERLGRSASPTTKHDRRLRGQLDAARRRSAAARRRPRSRCGRCRARRARSAAGRRRRRPGARRSSSSTSATPGDRRELLARRPIAASVSCSSCSPCTASWRRAPSSEASSSDDGASSARSRIARATAAASMRVAGADVQHRALRQRADDLVRARQHRVGAQRQRAGRQRLVEAEVRAPGLVDDQRHAAACATSAQRRDVGGHPVVGRRDDERRARRPARRRARRAAPPASTPCAIPSSASYSGATNAGTPPESTSPSTIEACELRWATTRAPSGASARHSAWLPCVAPLVRNHVRARAVGLGGQRSARS